MDIKISLKQLANLFIQSAADEGLPMPYRQFAAKLAVLTAHVDRVDRARLGLAKTVDDQIAELAHHLLENRPATPATAPAQAAPATPAEIDMPPMDEDDAAKMMADQVMRETEEEVAKLAKAPVAITARPNGGKVVVEEAS